MMTKDKEQIMIIREGKEQWISVDKAELTSDGYHTFKDLYEQRLVLSVIAFKYAQEKGWEVIRSKKHFGEDNECFGGGWFIVMVISPDGKQYSYHYENKYWDLFQYAKTVDHAPKWDGHTSKDVTRLLQLINK